MHRLLIVDDEEVMRNVLARYFATRNYETVTASSGEEAVRIVDEQPVDAVLLDISMPGMGGLEALARINARRPDVPVVMVTGVDDEQVARDAVQSGAFDYMLKPPDFEYLSQTLFVKLQLKLG
jgi:two-component system response regulator AtoC